MVVAAQGNPPRGFLFYHCSLYKSISRVDVLIFRIFAPDDEVEFPNICEKISERGSPVTQQVLEITNAPCSEGQPLYQEQDLVLTLFSNS